ncbi:hypothetical protein F6R97_04395 [Pseudomonas sp. JV414]|uniref:HEPN domain-containing protein n=1 Tax=Pseudomonas sp. JV414 TaxID=1733110 RepID=UPI0028E0EC6C|nr:HEPN domain-containing protein [Pseudomonas sp. JV414]MDT9673892.1 hypothetical protein [Pseudomonas sp. JV414]
MWKVKLLTTVRYLDFNVPSGSYEFMPGVNLIVGAKNVSDYIGSDFRRYAGEIEYAHFQRASNIVVGEFDHAAWGDDATSSEILFCWLVWIEWILQDSWLVYDSCIHSEIAFAKKSEKNKSVEWSNNNLASHASDSYGSRLAVTTISLNDLEQWIERSLKLRTYIHERGVTIATPVISKSYTRFARFINFVQLARRTSHPAMKIAQMCSALESLFSTDTSELTHRLSERVAMFLGGDGEAMEKSYQMMKKCYAVRSQITHGSHIKDSVAEQIPDMSFDMMVMLREIALKIIDSPELSKLFDGDNDGIEAYFRRLLFGIART